MTKKDAANESTETEESRQGTRQMETHEQEGTRPGHAEQAQEEMLKTRDMLLKKNKENTRKNINCQT